MMKKRVTDEIVGRWATINTDQIKTDTIQDICFATAFIAAKDIAADLIDARELISEFIKVGDEVVGWNVAYIPLIELLAKLKEYAV